MLLVKQHNQLRPTVGSRVQQPKYIETTLNINHQQNPCILLHNIFTLTSAWDNKCYLQPLAHYVQQKADLYFGPDEFYLNNVFDGEIMIIDDYTGLFLRVKETFFNTTKLRYICWLVTRFACQHQLQVHVDLTNGLPELACHMATSENVISGLEWSASST